MPVARAPEISNRAEERSRDHTTNSVVVGKLSCVRADPIKFLDRDHRLMGGNLQDGISRRVKNRAPGARMFLAELVQDVGATARVVAEKFPTRRARDLPDEFIRKRCEGRERFVEDGARQFPMPGRGVLSRRAFAHPAIACRPFSPSIPKRLAKPNEKR